MRRRTTPAYLEVFRYLKVITPCLRPDRVHCDFEVAQMNAVRVVWPLCRVVGCLWHYSVVSRWSKHESYMVYSVACILVTVTILTRLLYLCFFICSASAGRQESLGLLAYVRRTSWCYPLWPVSVLSRSCQDATCGLE